VAGLGTIRAEIRIGKDTGSAQTRERGECDRYFVDFEMPLGKKASDIQNEENVQNKSVSFLAYNAYWTLRKVNLGWNLCMEIRELTLTYNSHTRGEMQGLTF
jgi:hypothetical protein